jgi:hypothetical protein
MVCTPAATVEPTAMVTVEEAPEANEAGLKLTVTPAGDLAVKATVFMALPLSVTPMVKVVEFPVCTVPLLAEALRVKSLLDAAPLPHALSKSAPSTEPRPVARL